MTKEDKKQKFEIGDLVSFIDRTGAASKAHVVIVLDEEFGRLVAQRREGGRTYQINAAVKRFTKVRSVRDFYKPPAGQKGVIKTWKKD